MENKPYFCPNCRSNRVKFSMISSYAQRFLKDAITGAVQDFGEPEQLSTAEATIQCMICNFTGNELRFIKQAEREPRTMTPSNPTYM